jgi:hypothetical protein
LVVGEWRRHRGAGGVENELGVLQIGGHDGSDSFVHGLGFAHGSVVRFGEGRVICVDEPVMVVSELKPWMTVNSDGSAQIWVYGGDVGFATMMAKSHGLLCDELIIGRSTGCGCGLAEEARARWCFG